MFVYCPVDHQELHSFPTRRSSDPALAPVQRPAPVRLTAGAGGQPHDVAAVIGLGERERPQLLDRKSTRLNSSHSSISYAVFCLKKKKHLNMTYKKILL